MNGNAGARRAADLVFDLAARRHRCDPADVAALLIELRATTLLSTSDAFGRLPGRLTGCSCGRMESLIAPEASGERRTPRRLRTASCAD